MGGDTDYIIENADGIQINSETDWSWWENIENARKGNCTILTLADFKRLYCEEEKPQPRFEVGDWVIHNHKNREVGQIVACFPDEKCRYSVCFGEEYHNMAEHQLLPYTEPETKPTEDMETKENRNLSQDVANCDKPESKQLNLCNLIGDRDGIRVYCPTCGEVTLQAWDRGIHTKPLIFTQSDTSIVVRTFANGKAYAGGECCIFPSRVLYEQYPLDPLKAWSVWQEEQKKTISMEIVVYTQGKEAVHLPAFYASLPDRDKCIEEIKAIINKYSKQWRQ